MTIVVNAGEWLYLPAGWWHDVRQEEGDEGLCVAVNQ
jgi:quercetin dioxygenase-like cupin family protein